MDQQSIRSGQRWIDWLGTAPGRYMLDWEQARFDEAVADVFGYYALQCGLPQLDCLRANRMPSRIHARFVDDVGDMGAATDPAMTTLRLAHFEELPFASQSLDLVVLPHVLEFAHDPHQVLREVDRVLRPEGRVIVTGLNPVSLWGARQALLRGVLPPFLPGEGRFIGQPRLRDWLKLLGFELDHGRYGCFRPPCRTEKWLDRWAFVERLGDRWWPICGAVYFVAAVKRVRGMRLIGPAWKRSPAKRAAVAVPTAQFAPPAPPDGSRRRRAVSDTCSRETAEAD